MNRALFLLHRYLGIALGLVVAIWCLSGVVMMYVQYPELSETEQAGTLEPLALEGCCRLPDDLGLLASRPLDDLRIEMLAGTPVLRLTLGTRERRTLDLTTGAWQRPLGPGEAAGVAAAFAREAGIGDYRAAGRLERDQWTVYGAYDPLRPLYKFEAGDDAGTEWYVSAVTGEIVQVTTAGERFWNWLGAVPHWLYPTLLRQHVAVWSQTVIWLTILATFLTVVGVYVGVRQFRSRRNGRWSPYRGAGLWHHYVGLIFGALMLTWLVSGFFSMNPWGLLEGRSFAGEIERQRGGNLVLDAATVAAIERLPSLALEPGTTRLEARIAGGERFFLAVDRRGERSVPGQEIGDVMPFSQHALHEAAGRMRPGAAVAEEGWIHEDDAYYYTHHEPMPLPVYRIVFADGERFYLDGLTGEIVHAVDTSRRLYRWLHYGLHRGDFTAFLRQRPVWDALMLPLMIGVSLMGLTGAWLGLRRIRRWLGARSRRASPERSRFGLRSAGQAHR